MAHRRLIGLVVGMILPGLMLASSDVTCLRHGDADRAQLMAQATDGTDAHHHGESRHR